MKPAASRSTTNKPEGASKPTAASSSPSRSPTRKANPLAAYTSTANPVIVPKPAPVPKSQTPTPKVVPAAVVAVYSKHQSSPKSGAKSVGASPATPKKKLTMPSPPLPRKTLVSHTAPAKKSASAASTPAIGGRKLAHGVRTTTVAEPAATVKSPEPLSPASAAAAVHDAEERAFQKELATHSPRTQEKLLAEHEVRERKAAVLRDAAVKQAQEEAAALELAAQRQAQLDRAAAEAQRQAAEREAEEDRITAAMMEKVLAGRGIIRPEHTDAFDREALAAERARKADEEREERARVKEERLRRRSTMGDLDAITVAINKITLAKANAALRSRPTSAGSRAQSKKASRATSPVRSRAVTRPSSGERDARPTHEKKLSVNADPASTTHHGSRTVSTPVPTSGGVTFALPDQKEADAADHKKLSRVSRRMSMPRLKSVTASSLTAAAATRDLLAHGEASTFMQELAAMNNLILAAKKTAGEKITSARGSPTNTALAEFKAEYDAKVDAARALVAAGEMGVDPETRAAVTPTRLEAAKTLLQEDEVRKSKKAPEE